MFRRCPSISGTPFVRYLGVKAGVTEKFVRVSRLLQPSSFSKQDGKQAPQCRSQKVLRNSFLNQAHPFLFSVIVSIRRAACMGHVSNGCHLKTRDASQEWCLRIANKRTKPWHSRKTDVFQLCVRVLLLRLLTKRPVTSTLNRTRSLLLDRTSNAPRITADAK